MIRKYGAIFTATTLLAGCTYTIKLDPGAEDASVYVNGDLVGTGIARYDEKTEYGYAESFVAKVVPASSSLQAYSVTISREFDPGPALFNLGSSLISGGSLLLIHYLSVKSQIDQNPGNWPVLMFGGFNLGLAGGLAVINAPLNLLSYNRYREYYDLPTLRDQQKK